MERIRKERPPFLTIVSLQLPESPIPLIESQASARSRGVGNIGDDDSEERVGSSAIGGETGTVEELERGGGGRKRRRWRKRGGGRARGEELLECTKGAAPTLEECSKNVVEGQFKVRRSGQRLFIGIPAIRQCVKRNPFSARSRRSKICNRKFDSLR